MDDRSTFPTVAPCGFSVVLDSDAALVDLARITDRGERTAILNVIDKLRQLGDKLVPPHMQSLKGEADLFELRPRAGRSASRALCIRSGDDYVIVAVSRNHASDMDATIARARERIQRYA